MNTTSLYFPNALSGYIPAAEITNRIKEGKGMIRGSFLVGADPNTTSSKGIHLVFGTTSTFATSSFIINLPTAMSSTNGAICRTFEGYVCGSNIVFPSDVASNPFGTGTNALTTFPYGTDLYYKFGFTTGVSDNNKIIALSGGSISIIP